MSSDSKNKNCEKIVEENDKVVASFSRIPYYPLVVKRAYKSTVEDMDGNTFIDFLSSAGTLNVGHCHPKVVKSIIEQTKQSILYTPVYMYNKLLSELAQKLIEITPGNFPKQVTFGLSGSDANDGKAYAGMIKRHK